MNDPMPYVAEADIIDLVGAPAASRGKRYAREGAVEEIDFSRDVDGTGIVEAEVWGSGPVPYSTDILLRPGPERSSLGTTAYLPLRSTCTCPVRSGCKHAAAALYAATAASLRDIAGHGEGSLRAHQSSLWRTALADLADPADAAREQTPLAISVELISGFGGFGFSRFGSRRATLQDLRAGSPVAVALRPMLLGRSGSWIRGNLSWSSLRFEHPDLPYPAEQAALMARLVRPFTAHHTFQQSIGDLLRLDEAPGAEAWSLLSQAGAAGIELLTSGIIDSVRIASPAPLVVDVTGAEPRSGPRLPGVQPGDLLLTTGPAAEETQDAEGASAGESTPGGEDTPDHRATAEAPSTRRIIPQGSGGYARLDIGESAAGLTLLPLADTIPPSLRTLVASPQPVVIPAPDADEFCADILPQLARSASVASSDASVDVTAAPAARLEITVEHASDDRLLLEWTWQYRAPSRSLALQAAHRPGGRKRPSDRRTDRDLEHEDAVIGAIRGIIEARAPETLGPDALGAEELTGVQTAAFVEHVLPRLASLPDVDVHEIGTRGQYTELDGTPHLRITQVEKPNAQAHDWFDLGFEITLGDQLVPFTAIFKALSQGKKSVLMPDGTYFRLEHPTFDRLRELIGEAEAMEEWEPGAPAISRYQVAMWEELEDLADETEEARAWREGVGSLRDLTEIPVPDPAPGLAATLRPYQLEGYAWLSFLADHRLGGILADDMGLGKTLQTLAAIARLRAREPDAPPVLVVAPSSVLSVWKREAERFTPDLDVRVLDTTAAKRGSDLAGAIAGADMVVTSYTLLRLGEAEHTALTWQGLILDEAQAVKNPRARAHRAAAQIRAPFRLAITGTPMENSLMDLWALLALTAPGLFASQQAFKEQYVKPIEKPDASDSGARRAADRMARLRRRIRPFVLRRTKDVVAPELPPKQEQVLRIPLEGAHRRLYDRILQRERQKLLGLVADIDRHRFIVFRSLTLLRMLALDPAIVDEEHADVASSKLEVVLDQLAEVASEGHRVLVFSQFTSHLARVSERLSARGVDHAYLDGSTRDRVGVIEGFREGTAPIFLISLKAGGFGLTLTEADYVYLLDPWWNPAAEAQAIDRAHRIGQDSPVMVYRMVAEDTIEEKVLELQERKRELFSALTDDEQAFSAAITAEDVRALLE